MSELLQWLISDGLLDRGQVERVMRHQAESGAPLCMALIDLELVKESDLVSVQARRHNLPRAPRKLHKLSIAPKVLAAIPEDHCWQYGVFPFGADPSSGALQVAIADPSYSEAIELLEGLEGYRAELYVAGPRQVEKAIRKHYMDSWVEETGGPRLRFFGYDDFTAPGGAAKGQSRDSDSTNTAVVDEIVAAQPGAPAPCREGVPSPEPVDREHPSRRTGGQETVARPDPRPPEAAAPRAAAGKSGGAPLGKLTRQHAAVDDLVQRVDALERAVVELVALVQAGSQESAARAGAIAERLQRVARWKAPER